MAVSLLSQAGVDIFGKRYCKNISNGIETFNGLRFTGFNQEEKLLDICTKILDGNTAGINKLLVDRLVLDLYQNPGVITSILLKAFDITSKKFHAWIQDNIQDSTHRVVGSFTKSFLEKYQTYYNNTVLLRKTLWYYDMNMLTDKEQKSKYSYIMLVKNVAILANVINEPYNYDGKSIHLYDIFNKFLDTNTVLDDVLRLFKIYQFYNKFTNMSFISKDDKSKFFTNCSTKFVLTENANSKQLISSLIENVNESIKCVSKEKEADKVTEMLNSIRDILQMGINIGDKQYFLLLYRSLLTERLYKYQSDPEVELELMKMFMSYKEDPELYAKMRFQITDAISSKDHEEIFRNLSVELRSQRFENWDIKKLRRSACNFLVMRSYAWDIKDFEQYTEPDEVAIYLSIFAAYFHNRFPDSKLTFLHNQSTGVLKMKLANDEEYSIQMTLSQMFVILTINKSETLSARDISKALASPLNKLAPILNSLLEVDLITRSTGASNDPNILFTINWNRSYPDKKFSIIDLIKKAQQMSNNNNQKPKSNISQTVLRSKLLSIMMTNKMIYTDLKQQLEKAVNETISNELLQEEIQYLLKNNFIVQDGEYLSYKTRTAFIEEDSDDEVSKDTSLCQDSQATTSSTNIANDDDESTVTKQNMSVVHNDDGIDDCDMPPLEDESCDSTKEIVQAIK